VFPRPLEAGGVQEGCRGASPGGLCIYQVVNEREGEANNCGLGAAI
jgi:hypothetical protein